MTNAVIERMEEAEFVRMLCFVRDTIGADLAVRNESVWADSVDVNVDVERLFASVDLLAHRYDQPWSPFVANWHRGLETFAAPRLLTEHDLFFELNNFKDALAPPARPD